MSRVLIVDDDEENLYLLRTLLRKHGHTLNEARNGEEALKSARETLPDLTISDLLMPVMDGYSLLREWKSDERLREIPFIVYTATYTDSRDEQLAIDLGADAFLIKPAEPKAFIARIERILAKQEQGELPPASMPLAEEPALLRQYNEVLVRKLEKRALQLEQINRTLEADIAAREEVEASLRAAEGELRRLAETMPQLVWMASPDGGNIYVNQRWIDFTGLSVEESRGDGWQSIVHPVDRKRVLQAWKNAISGGDDFAVEFRLRRFDGSHHWMLVRALLSRDEEGRITKWIGTCTNIDELKRALALVQEQAALLDKAQDAILVRDSEHRVTYWNKSAERLYGWTAEEVLGRSVRDLLFRDTGAFDAAAARLAERGEWTGEFAQVCKDGRPVTVEARWTLVRAGRGGPSSVLVVNTDITERRQSEDTLRLRDRAIQQVSQGILITDPNRPDHPIVYAGAGFERMTGYRPDEVLGQNCRLLQGRDTDQETVAGLREAIAEKRPCTVEILNYRKDGTPFWNALSVNPVHDETGAVEYFVGVQSDITGQRRLEEQLRQSQKMEAVGRLAGGIAHDFNNLLTIVCGYTEQLLGMKGLDDEARNSISAIGDAGGRAAALTRQLLGFSRQSVLQPRILDLNAVVRETAQLLKRLIGEDIRFATVLDPKLSPVRVDPGHLNQVLMNLAVNARDAMPQGGQLTIETTNVLLTGDYVAGHLDSRTGPHVTLTMTDTGCGMSPDIVARIFEPFFTTKPVGQGTGLGLAMVFGIVRQSDGWISVYSEPGHGTTFRIYFPAVAQEPDRERPPAPSSAARGTETVLLVEDDDGVRTMTAIILERYGYTVLAASGAREAMEIAETCAEPIDLVLTDVVMPNVSGPQLAESLRARLPNLKVLFMSGYTGDAVVRHGLLDATVSFMQKPYTPLGLAQKIREVLDRKEPAPLKRATTSRSDS